MRPIKSTVHSLKMVARNRRSYALLSVTIVLSFSLLLGYLCFMDSSHYNKYKEVFAFDRGRVSVNVLTSAATDRLIENRLSGIDGTGYELLHSCTAFTMAFSELKLDTGEIVIMPHETEVWSLPAHAAEFDAVDRSMAEWVPAEINWLDGKEHEDVHLALDEIIIDEELYRTFELDKRESFAFTLTSTWGVSDVYSVRGEYRVVGTVPPSGSIELDLETKDGYAFVTGDYVPEILFSGEAVSPADSPDLPWQSLFIIGTQQPETAVQTVNALFDYDPARGFYEMQDEANAVMRAENRTKAIICTALLVILGVNLWSCFENALKERRFEIGVKRALGASAISIVIQFLTESLAVMLANIFISVALVTDIFIVYKFIYERTPDEYGQFLKWTICISPYSALMFAVCAAALTLVFSLIFAARSTQVRIADQLKAE